MTTRKTRIASSAASMIDPVTGKALTEDDIRRSGAWDCLLAMRALVKAAETIGSGRDTPKEYHDKQLADAKTFAAELGPMPPRLEGIVFAMAEYIHFGNSTGWPNLDQWMPDSAMTVTDREAMIERMNAEQAPDIKSAGLAAEGATSSFEEIDLFDYADAFNKIEALAERLVMQVPRELCDIAFSIKTIAKSFGSEMQGMSEFYTDVPTTALIRKGGAA